MNPHDVVEHFEDPAGIAIVDPLLQSGEGRVAGRTGERVGIVDEDDRDAATLEDRVELRQEARVVRTSRGEPPGVVSVEPEERSAGRIAEKVRKELGAVALVHPDVREVP